MRVNVRGGGSSFSVVCRAVGWLVGTVSIVSLGLASAALASVGAPSYESVRLAYLDPGSGSFVVQALIAMLAGIAVTARMYWARIKSLLGMASDADDDDEDAPSEDA